MSGGLGPPFLCVSPMADMLVFGASPKRLIFLQERPLATP